MKMSMRSTLKHIKIGENYIHDKNPNTEKRDQATQNINVCVTDFTRLEYSRWFIRI
jgi:hypothetical protein